MHILAAAMVCLINAERWFNPLPGAVIWFVFGDLIIGPHTMTP